jgi:uncharacterized membrane protein SpoIIM required for sporulation
MLESLVDFKNLKKKPYLIFFWTVIVASVAILISYQIGFSEFGKGLGTVYDIRGFFVVLFAMIPATYLMTQYIKEEEELEEKEITKKYKSHLFNRHASDLYIVLIFFFTLVLTFSVWSFFLPETFFQVQEVELNKIGAHPSTVSGFVSQDSGSFCSKPDGKIGVFLCYIQNNIGVTLFSLVIGLLFGAGAIFILTWNASILSTKIALHAGALHGIPAATSPFLFHGVLEIGGYILAGFAGSLISAAIIRGHHKRDVFKSILFDTAMLFAIAIVFIVLGAFVEAFL